MLNKIVALLVVCAATGCVDEECRGPYSSLAASNIVCEDCSPDELEQESAGIRAAAGALIEYIGGEDLMPEVSPVTIHVAGDSSCSEEFAEENGIAAYYDSASCNICLLYDLERRRQCTDCAAESEATAHRTVIHEGLHAWFRGRIVHDYRIEEGFCQYVELDASGILVFINETHDDLEISTNPCTHIRGEFVTPGAQLMGELCEFGITSDHVKTILETTASAASAKGTPLSAREFEGIVTRAMGQDTHPAFQVAGILD